MPIEFEAKVLDVDAGDIERRIIGAGGRRVGGGLLRRYVYDVEPGDESRWIRLRDTGAEVTLTVKEIAHDGIDGTTETEVEVSDFATTDELLRRIGFVAKSYQENRRESFELAGARLEIDAWPSLRVGRFSAESLLKSARRPTVCRTCPSNRPLGRSCS